MRSGKVSLSLSSPLIGGCKGWIPAIARASYKRQRSRVISGAWNIERESIMKLDRLLEEILWEIELAGKDCPEAIKRFEDEIKKAIYI